jgi:pyruvate,water dikinase
VLRGAAASAGVATGPAVHCRASDLDSLPSVAGRVLVLDDPLPQFAPLLWEAAGLVALRGNPGAHLCQVARSLHVPAVVGLESASGPEVLGTDDAQVWLVVDGDAGEVVVERRDGAATMDRSHA